jgi:hypothetical protein
VRGLLLVSLFLGTQALVGCAEARAPVPSKSPTAVAPVFASDEEALAAATEAYAAYLNRSNQITADGGADPLRISSFVTDKRLSAELQAFAEFAQAGARSIGATSFFITDLQSASYAKRAETSVVLYLCEDVSLVDVVDIEGTSLVAPSRKPVTPFEATMRLNHEGELVLDERAVWGGKNFCS